MLTLNSVQNGHLKRYLDLNFRFARTVVIKFDVAAALVNEGVVEQQGVGSVDTTQPATWKYYRHLAGQYHPSDTMMTVVSIDTLETIEFTAENLAIHTATAEAHAFGTRHYYALVARYPQQETLINGILNPVPLATAIDAPNGTILGYPKGLVEANEVTLIPALQAYLQRQIQRWFNTQFAMSDELYCAATITQLHYFVLTKLLSLRQLRCKTPEAHSFHVRMYLASHSELDRFLPYLTLKQSLWLYRNISYLERNPGQSSQFQKLVKKLFTERGIPLSEYSVRHLDAFTSDYLPTLTARQKTLNAGTNATDVKYHPVEDLYALELQNAAGNAEDWAHHHAKYLETLKVAGSAVTQTKLLHSAMVDYSNAVPEPFEVVAVRQWCAMVARELYNVVVPFKDPTTGENYTLFAREAFLYTQWLLCTADGMTFTQFPDYLNLQQRRHPLPSVDDLLSMVDHQTRDLRAVAMRILRRQPVISECFSVSSFYEQVKTLTDEAFWHWCLISSTEDLWERALVENMIRRLYEDVRVSFPMEQPTIEAWLSHHNLPLSPMTRSEKLLLAQAVYEAATGLTIDDARMLKHIQKAMVDLMTTLSSYTIQVTREINEDDIIPINWPAVRFGHLRFRQQDARELDVGSEVLSLKGRGKDAAAIGLTLGLSLEAKPATTGYRTTLAIDPSTTSLAKVCVRSLVSDSAPSMQLGIRYTGQNEALDTEMGVPGYTTFDALPESARKSLKSIYARE